MQISKKVKLSNLDKDPDLYYDLCDWSDSPENHLKKIPHPFKHDSSFKQHEIRIATKLKKLNDSLANYLNYYFNVSFSFRYWEIILSPYSLYWISSLYQKHIRIKTLIEFDQELHFNFFEQNDKMIIEDQFDYLEKTNSEEQNHYEFQLLIQFLQNKYSYPFIINRIHKYPKNRNSKNNNRLGQIFKTFISIKKNTYVSNVYGLGLKEKFKINILPNIINILSRSFNFDWSAIYPNTKANLNSKKNYLSDFGFKIEDELDEILNDLTIEYIPKNILKEIPRQPFLFRIKNWLGNIEYGDIIKMHYIARIVENNGNWYSVQHGGCYGNLNSMASTYIEYGLTDSFITWGWKNHSDYQVNSIPMPSPLVSRENEYTFSNQVDILLIGNSAPLTLVRFDSNLHRMHLYQYKLEQLNFFKNIKENLVNHLVFRDYSDNNQICSKFNDFLKIKNIPLTKNSSVAAAKNARIAVVDHCSTSFLQTLALNIPTLIFWNENINLLSEETNLDLSELKKVQIFHDNAKSAADFINNNYENLNAWWLSEATQIAKNKFVYKYARYDKNFIQIWKNFLQNLN